jgi:anti-sigma regulatory factor (Ser/Thr protein kinase)
MVPAPSFALRVAASPAGIRLAADALDRFRADHGFRDLTAWPLQVALDEILSNIVRHAGAGPTEAIIDVTVELRNDTLEMTVSDDGPAFNPLQLPEPDVTAALEERRPGGLGVHLVRKLMDHVEYRRVEGRNCLVMTWRRPRPGTRDT